jgi:Flp pilus assembly protein TadG
VFSSITKSLHNRKGQSLVEAAVLLPILLLIIFGIIEFGRIFSAYAIVNNTARDWSRRAAIYGYEETFVETEAEAELLSGFGITTAVVQASSFVDAEGDNSIEVKIIYEVPLIAPIISAIIDDDADGDFTITAICSMRYE